MPTEVRFDDLDLHEQAARDDGMFAAAMRPSDNPQCCSSVTVTTGFQRS